MRVASSRSVCAKRRGRAGTSLGSDRAAGQDLHVRKWAFLAAALMLVASVWVGDRDLVAAGLAKRL